MDILVNVINQKLKTKANTKRLVSGTQKFIRFKFSLDDAWDGLLVFAQFIQNGKAYNDYLDENNSVYLPPEIEDGKFDVLLYGSGSNTIATTNYLTFEVDKNILISDAQSTEITESLYNKLVNIVETLPISGNADTGASVIGKESVEPFSVGKALRTGPGFTEFRAHLLIEAAHSKKNSLVEHFSGVGDHLQIADFAGVVGIDQLPVLVVLGRIIEIFIRQLPDEAGIDGISVFVFLNVILKTNLARHQLTSFPC